MYRLLGLFLSSWLFGPVSGVAYARMCGIGPVPAFVLITLFDLSVGCMWVCVAERLFMGREPMYRVSRRKVSLLAFTMGEMTSVMVAYAGNLRRRALPYIFLFSSMSRTMLLLGAIGALLLVDPLALYMVGVAVMVMTTGRALYRNRGRVARYVVRFLSQGRKRL